MGFVRCTTKEQADALYRAGLAWFDIGNGEEYPDVYSGVQPNPYSDETDLPSGYKQIPACDWLYLLEE